jgi:hypothetical protein
MPIILATQKAEIRRIMVQKQPRQIVQETYLEENHHLKKKKKKKELVKWLKV